MGIVDGLILFVVMEIMMWRRHLSKGQKQEVWHQLKSIVDEIKE